MVKEANIYPSFPFFYEKKCLRSRTEMTVSSSQWGRRAYRLIQNSDKIQLRSKGVWHRCFTFTIHNYECESNTSSRLEQNSSFKWPYITVQYVEIGSLHNGSMLTFGHAWHGMDLRKMKMSRLQRVWRPSTPDFFLQTATPLILQPALAKQHHRG